MDGKDSALKLSVQDRRRLLRRGILRPVVTALLLVLAYFLLPLDGGDNFSTLTVLIVGIVAVCAICAWHVRKILHAEFPAVRAAEALVAILALYLVGFATVYYLQSQASADNFAEPLSKIDALYFCLGVFSTVGFGDIAATSELARATVIVQIVGNLTIIAVGIRLLSAAVKWSQELRKGSDPAGE